MPHVSDKRTLSKGTDFPVFDAQDPAALLEECVELQQECTVDKTKVVAT